MEKVNQIQLADSSIPLPERCQDFQSDFDSYVYNYKWEPWVIMGCIALCYGLAALYYFNSRHAVSFMTRSPLLIAISLLSLGVDSIINTLIFSSIEIGDIFHFQCNLGITATVLGQFAF